MEEDEDGDDGITPVGDDGLCDTVGLVEGGGDNDNVGYRDDTLVGTSDGDRDGALDGEGDGWVVGPWVKPSKSYNNTSPLLSL